MSNRILVISGSHRDPSQSSKVARFCRAELEKLGCESDLFELANNPLPFWDESFWEGDPKWKLVWSPIEARIRAADGYVIVSPEWHGMVPSGLKNLFLFCTGDLMAHKPATIVTVSAGQGGAYPLNELRTSSYKNSRLLYLPDHVIVRKAESVLNGATPADKGDERIRTRLAYSLEMLKAYAAALKPVREIGASRLKEFPTGM